MKLHGRRQTHVGDTDADVLALTYNAEETVMSRHNAFKTGLLRDFIASRRLLRKLEARRAVLLGFRKHITIVSNNLYL